MKTKLIVVAGALMLTLSLASTVSATTDRRVDICHFDGESEEFQTLHLGRRNANFHLEHHEGDYKGKCTEPTPTPSPTPVVEQTPPPTTQGAEGCSQDCHPEYHAPVCTGDFADKPAWVHVDRVSPTELKLQWASNNADSFALVYGYTGGNMEFGIPHLNGDSREVNVGQLEQNRSINVQLFAYRGNCSVSSEVIDP